MYIFDTAHIYIYIYILCIVSCLVGPGTFGGRSPGQKIERFENVFKLFGLVAEWMACPRRPVMFQKVLKRVWHRSADMQECRRMGARDRAMLPNSPGSGGEGNPALLKGHDKSSPKDSLAMGLRHQPGLHGRSAT